MHYLRYFILLSITLLVVLTGCKEKEEPKNDVNNRTVLVYMLADNNLGNYYNYDASNIESMCQSFNGKTIDGHLLIFQDDANIEPTLKEIIKPSPDKPCEIKTLKTYPDAITTDPETISQVLNDVKMLTPSSNYGLILWSHATGWLPQNRFYAPGRSAAPTSLGREGDEERSIDIDVLAKALDACHFDFILFDACLMGNVETAYELRNTCDYIIASPTETVGEGYPYKSITSMLFKKEIDYKSICEQYFQGVSRIPQMGGTITLINTQGLEQLADACQSLVANHLEDLETIDTKTIQYYDRPRPHVFFDLGHYMQTLSSNNDEQLEENEFNEEYERVKEALAKVVEYKAATPKFIDIPINHYCGLSCYIPYTCKDSIAEEYYRQLQWYKRLYETNK